ncbi:MAG: hypothetical protein Q6365_023935 [Candidatus Sigynarchaeota archaeon]
MAATRLRRPCIMVHQPCIEDHPRCIASSPAVHRGSPAVQGGDGDPRSDRAAPLAWISRTREAGGTARDARIAPNVH